jgi:LruC domain-containing protein
MDDRMTPRSLLLALALSAVAAPALGQDADGDGAPDAADAFPCDATLQAEAFFPAEGQLGTLLMEDEWPYAGDQDFNDLVLDWYFHAKMDGAGVRTLTATFDVVALGGQHALGLGLGLPVPKASLQSAALSVDGGPSQALSASGADADLVLAIPDLRAALGLPAGPLNVIEGGATAGSRRLTITLTFGPGVVLDGPAAPFDVFALRSGPGAQPGHELHRPEYSGTAGMDTRLFQTGDDASTPSRSFVDRAGLPFVLSIPAQVAYPKELTHLAALFPDVLGFASSGGTTHRDFYVSVVQASQAYGGRAAGAAPTTPVADASCRYATLCEGGKAWTKIYQIANGFDRASSSFPLTTAAVGDVRSPSTGFNAKLSDAAINALATPLDGYARVYRMHSTDASQKLYVRTQNAYNDLLSSFGVIGGATRVALGGTYNTVGTWASLPGANHGIDLLYTSPNLGGESCDRYFLGHGALDCWSGPSNVRCVNGGAYCGGYRKLQNVTLWIYTGGC